MHWLYIFLFFTSSCSYAQTLDFTVGYNKTSYFDRDDHGHFRGNYQGNYGFNVGIGLSKFFISDINYRIYFYIEQSGGDVYVSDGGLAGGYQIDANIKKTTAVYQIFPLNFTIAKKVDLSFGLESSFLLFKKLAGKQTTWLMNVSTSTDRESIISPFSIGASGMINFTFPLSKSLVLKPIYNFYYGFNSELATSSAVKSMRHRFLIGIAKNL